MDSIKEGKSRNLIKEKLIIFFIKAVKGFSIEGKLRKWIEEKLIAPGDNPDIFRYYKKEKYGIPSRVIDSLCDSYLIRKEESDDIVSISLSHINSIQPILHSNREWRERQRKKKKVILFPIFILLVGLSFLFTIKLYDKKIKEHELSERQEFIDLLTSSRFGAFHKFKKIDYII